jgi:hypothetical protein
MDLKIISLYHLSIQAYHYHYFFTFILSTKFTLLLFLILLLLYLFLLVITVDVLLDLLLLNNDLNFDFWTFLTLCLIQDFSVWELLLGLVLLDILFLFQIYPIRMSVSFKKAYGGTGRFLGAGPFLMRPEVS